MSSLDPVVNVPAHLKVHFRRTIMIGVAVGVIGLVALVATGHAWLGLFGCLGILLGALNALLVQRSVVAYGNSESNSKKALTGSIAGRLALITAVAIVIGIVFRPNGVGVFGGLMIFQVINLGGTALPMMRGMRQ
jgi:hypothetical protein